MTRKEIIELLNIVRSAYPNTKITSPKDTVSAWELAFSEDSAEVIYKAARHHINTCKFFPTVADIRKSINKGQILYGQEQEASPRAIEAPKKKIEVYCQGAWACPYFEADMCMGNKEEYDICEF